MTIRVPLVLGCSGGQRSISLEYQTQPNSTPYTFDTLLTGMHTQGNGKQGHSGNFGNECHLVT